LFNFLFKIAFRANRAVKMCCVGYEYTFVIFLG